MITSESTTINELGVVQAELHNATKRFGTVEAVTGVNLSVRGGELLAVLGPNGAGKTTAISMLTGLRRPTSGTARLFGRDPRDIAARRRVGVMLQASGVPETLRVGELLNEFRGYYPDPLPLPAIAEAAGLDGLERRLYGELSGGQQRRVLFGIALRQPGAPVLRPAPKGSPSIDAARVAGRRSAVITEPEDGLDVCLSGPTADGWSVWRRQRRWAPIFQAWMRGKRPRRAFGLV